MPPTIDDQMPIIAACCWRDATSDWLSCQLGFKRGMPRYGSWIHRWFRSAWRVRLDRSLRVELLCVVIAYQIRRGNLLDSDIERIARLFNQTPAMTKALNFASRSEGISHLRERIELYSRQPIAKWSLIIFREVDSSSIPEKSPLAGTLLMGLVQFTAYLREQLETHLRERGR